MISLRARLQHALGDAIARLVAASTLPASASGVEVRVVPPREAHMGDWSTQIALRLAREAGRPAREVATALAAALGDAGGLVARLEVAGPGYLNMFLADAPVRATVLDVERLGAEFVRPTLPPRGRVLVEFVSANPTGPLHVAHGRGAVMGDVIARLLAATHWQVEREYYVNDQGHQIDVLARSVWLRYLDACGRPVVFPSDFYPGDYVAEMATALHRELGDSWAPVDPFEPAAPPPPPPALTTRSVAALLARIKADLATFGIVYDHFVSERELCERRDVAALIAGLRAPDNQGLVYREGGRLWFRATTFGDDKDRVLVREDGRPTYFAGDLAYHHDKMERGFTRLVNIWGADHGGYVARVRGGMAAFGHDPGVLEVVLMQMVSLSRNGAQVRMGKRLGTAVWLADLVAEVGADAVRYLFLRQRADAQMDFDVDLAKSESLDNPVYYAQMGHARLAAIGRRAAAAGIVAGPATAETLTALTLRDELQLLKTLARAPDVVEDAARGMQPHLLAGYVQALIGEFHSYYTRNKHSARIVGEADSPATHARLAMCGALRRVIAALLALLGVSAPDEMRLPQES